MSRSDRLRVLLLVLAAIVLRVSRSGAADPPPAPATQPAAGLLSAEYSEYEWKRDDKPVRMIHRDEGFCFLSSFGGHFAGGGEAVRVYIGEDGFWYLGGQAAQDIWAKAMSVKFSHKLKTAMVLPPETDVVAWNAALPTLAASDDAGVKQLAAREQAGLPSDPAELLELAAKWGASAPKVAAEPRQLLGQHLVRLYEAAFDQLSGAALDAARQKRDAALLALAGGQANELAGWATRRGQWSMNDGKIEAHGDSLAVLHSPLPPDCFVQFRLNVVDGMRPRILFGGTDIYVGNEGFDHVIDLYGAQQRRGIVTSYTNGEDLLIAVKFSGKDVELSVNGELMVKGTRPVVPRSMDLTVRGGDDWSPGTIRIWDFKISAAP